MITTRLVIIIMNTIIMVLVFTKKIYSYSYGDKDGVMMIM